MSRSVFLSYCRADSQPVERLADDVRELGYSPWLDQQIRGGQAWWDEILRRIRGADIVVIVLSTAALESDACLREYAYAAALGKPILPIRVNADFTPARLPAALAALQIVTWKPDDASAARRLSLALMNMPPAPVAPTVEPTPPAAPLSYLASLHERVTTPQPLDLEEQSALCIELKRRARAGKDREELRGLMQTLRERADLFASVAEELDEELAQASLSPIEIQNSTLTTRRKRKRLILAAAGTACWLFAGIGAYVFRGPTAGKPPPAPARPAVVAVTSEQARDESPTVPSTNGKPTETATPEARTEESMQRGASTQETVPVVPTPTNRNPRSSPIAKPTQPSVFAQMAAALHTWEVTADRDCVRESVRPEDCIRAEKVTANLNTNGTATWEACSCKLNAAARKAIEETAVWL